MLLLLLRWWQQQWSFSVCFVSTNAQKTYGETKFSRGTKNASDLSIWWSKRLVSSSELYESLQSHFCKTLVHVSTSRTDRSRMLMHNGYDTYFSEFVVQFPFFWRCYFEDSIKNDQIGSKGMEGSVDTLSDTFLGNSKVSQLITTRNLSAHTKSIVNCTLRWQHWVK